MVRDVFSNIPGILSPVPLATWVKCRNNTPGGYWETETEYLWRICLTGGDRILLSEDEARGYWGPGVFLTTDNNKEPWPLTQRVAYWAGGLDSVKKGTLFLFLIEKASAFLWRTYQYPLWLWCCAVSQLSLPLLHLAAQCLDQSIRPIEGNPGNLHSINSRHQPELSPCQGH